MSADQSKKGVCLLCGKEIPNWWEQFCSKECVEEYRKLISRESYPEKKMREK